MQERNYLRAYLQLQEAHKMLHKALKAMETDEDEELILMRIERTQTQVQQALDLIS